MIVCYMYKAVKLTGHYAKDERATIKAVICLFPSKLYPKKIYIAQVYELRYCFSAE